jgi:hypothetical protein
MDIPMNVRVYCTDGECGRSARLIVNPVTRTVTHLSCGKETRPIPSGW